MRMMGILNFIAPKFSFINFSMKGEIGRKNMSRMGGTLGVDTGEMTNSPIFHSDT